MELYDAIGENFWCEMDWKLKSVNCMVEHSVVRCGNKVELVVCGKLKCGLWE